MVYSAKSDKSSSSNTKPIPDPVPDPIVPATKPPTPRPSPRPTEPCKECDEIIPEIVPGDKPTPTGPTDDVPRPTPPSPPLTPSEVEVVPQPPSPTSPDSPTPSGPEPIIPGDKPTPTSEEPPAPTPADRPTEPTSPTTPTPPGPTPAGPTTPGSPTEPTPTSPSSPSSPSGPTPPESPTEPTPDPIIPGDKPAPVSPTPPAPTPEDRPLEPAETPIDATNCLNDPSWTSTDGDDCEAVESNPVSLCNTASSSGGVSASAACPAACNTECLANCDVNPNWSTGSGETCDDVAKDPIGLCGSVGTTSGSGAVTAIDACPTSCKDECLDNCDNDPFWITKDDETCDDVATDPKGLCDKLKSKDDDEKASTACPAACNLECYDNCDNSPFWENGNKQGCADVAEDPKAFCDTVDKDDVPANEACPAACNVECLLIPNEVEEIDFTPPTPSTPSPPVPSPITPSGGGPMIGVPTYQPTGLSTGAWTFPTYKPTNGASVTVGQGAESAPTLPPAGRLDGTTFPTDFVPTIPTAKPTSEASGGVTITVSTETTGPPTLENREPDSA